MMKTYCIHLTESKQEIDLYEYIDSQLISNSRVSFTDLDQYIEGNSKLYFFIPSYLVHSFSLTRNENETMEQFKARFFSEHDDIIINSVSENKFFYHHENSLVHLVNKNIINEFNQKINALGCTPIILPEHYLNYFYVSESILEINDRLIVAFEDGTGHSSNYSNLKQYISIAKKERATLRTTCINIVDEPFIKTIFKNPVFDSVSLEVLHQNIMGLTLSEIPNLFKYQFSIKNILNRLKLSRLEKIVSIGLVLAFLILPNLNIYFMKLYESQYKEATLEIFQSINPNTKRVINPKLQIDQIIKASEIKPTEVLLDLDILKVLDRIDLKLINTMRVNVDSSTVELNFKNVSSIKYGIFMKLIESLEVKLIDEDINNLDGSINGTIKLIYNDE